MKKERNRLYVKIIEMVLMLASIVITVLPLFFCIAILSDTLRFDLPEHIWRAIWIIAAAIVVILSFFAQLFRVINILRNTVSRIVTIGLLMGLGAYLFVMIPVLPDLMHIKVQLLLVYTIPLIAILFSLRNSYLQRKQGKQSQDERTAPSAGSNM